MTRAADPWALARQITPDRWADDHRRQLQDRLARMFGERFGWRFARKPFSAECLARRGCYDAPITRWYAAPGVLREATMWNPAYWCRYSDLFDHGYYYRTGGRAAAIAAHLYNWEEGKQAAVSAHAAEIGLAVREVIDFPSWWYPGVTRLVLWTRAAATRT